MVRVIWVPTSPSWDHRGSKIRPQHPISPIHDTSKEHFSVVGSWGERDLRARVLALHRAVSAGFGGLTTVSTVLSILSSTEAATTARQAPYVHAMDPWPGVHRGCPPMPSTGTPHGQSRRSANTPSFWGRSMKLARMVLGAPLFICLVLSNP